MKTCTRCETESSDFSPDRKMRDGLSSWCRACHRAKTNLWKITKQYGLAPGDYQRMIEAQGGVCAICLGPQQHGKRLCIDHDHKTGEVRGLLCFACNHAIGKLGDSPETVRRALAYLERDDLTKVVR